MAAQVALLAVRGLERTSAGFRGELVRMCARLGVSPNFVAAVMSIESNGIHADAVNPNGGATGLIQFMPETARRLGTSTTALRAMNATQQLKYVELFYRPHMGRLGRPVDVYMATFLPVFLGAPPGTVLGQLGNEETLPGSSLTFDQVYRANKGFDRDNNGFIQVAEVGVTIERELEIARRRPPVMADPFAPPDNDTSALAWMGFALFAGWGLTRFFKGGN